MATDRPKQAYLMGARPKVRMPSRADIAAEALRGAPDFTLNNQNINTNETEIVDHWESSDNSWDVWEERFGDETP